MTIGLERTIYTTEENDRRQEVCAVVIDNGVELRRSVEVVMSTRPGTALGIYVVTISDKGSYGSFNVWFLQCAYMYF